MTPRSMRLPAALVLSLAACIERTPPAQSDSTAATATTGAEQPDVGAFMDSLRALHSEYTSVDGYRWSVAAGQALLAQVGNLGDPIVDSLVACLGDESPSNVTLDGIPVATAIVCFEALKRTAVIPSAEDSGAPWPGVLRPQSSVEDIRAAHAVWREVLAARRYRRM